MPPPTFPQVSRFAKVFSAMACLAAAICTQAQTKPAGFTYTISAQADSYGLHSVTVRNVSQQDITAIHAFSVCGTGKESNSIGSDSLLQFVFLQSKSIAFNGPSIIQPSRDRTFDMPLSSDGCHQGVSVLFSDGHGAGDDDSLYGWHQMIADRYSSYAELQRIRGIVQGMSESEADFPGTLLKSLDVRRSALGDRSLRDVPKSEVPSRSYILEALLSNMRDPYRMTDDLKHRESALLLVDSWMAPLRAHGYDKPAQ